MLTISKNPQRLGPILIVVAATLAVWLLSKWYYQDWFDDYYKYVAKTVSLTTAVLMSCGFILSARWRCLERFFGGLDKVYQVHKRLGKYAFFLILLHPVFLAAHRLPDLPAFLRGLWLYHPQGDRYLWGHNAGVILLLVFAVLMLPTLWVKIPYHLWKRTHEFFGLALVGLAVHVFLVKADVARYPVLTAWFYGWLALAFFSFVFIRFCYRFWGPRFPYRVSLIEPVADILEITFTPGGRKMDFLPGQFVYLVVRKPGVSPEPHPYSIAGGYNLDAALKLGIKKVGDHTRSLDQLAVGDPVDFYGPYGHFSAPFWHTEQDCVFVGAGIGVTPFIGMWHVALHAEARLANHKVPGPIRRLHPEILKSWKSPRVFFFYVCRTQAEASFDDDIRQEIFSSPFHTLRQLERAGHRYELYLTSEQGRISADYLDRRTRGGLPGKYLFLCGPSPMIDDLRRQFALLGIPDRQIIVEDFNLY